MKMIGVYTKMRIIPAHIVGMVTKLTYPTALQCGYEMAGFSYCYRNAQLAFYVGQPATHCNL